MHVLTNAEKLIPLRDAASLAESRRLAGMRMVTGTTSPSTRYERISVSPASCSIKSEYVIASHAFKPQYKCINYTPAWEQRKFSNLTDRVSMQSSDPDLPQVEYEDIVSGEGTLNKDLRDKEGGKTGIKFYAGDVLYGKLRPYLMNWLYPQFNGVAVGDFWVLRATECDSSFLYRLVQTDSFQRLANVSSGSKMPRADWNLISQSFFAVPADYAEQRVIAKSLAELDDLITLHQRKRQWLKWLDEGGEGTHHDIDILVFKFADDMKISVLCGVHACMTKSLGHTGNRYAGKQQQRGMGVP